MNTHHLTLGTLIDFLSGKEITDTHDERYRQKIAKILVMEKHIGKNDIIAQQKLTVKTPEKKAAIPVDFIVHSEGRAVMLIKYGPGSIVTRHRPALAMSRLLVPHQIPVVVVTNGEDADILYGKTGLVIRSGLDAIPDKDELSSINRDETPVIITPLRAEMESRILYTMEVDGSCPCDTDICRFENE